MTNADRIRSMTDEELADMIMNIEDICLIDFMCHVDCEGKVCSECINEHPDLVEWLQSEAE
ncbi:hypothetical protein H8R94_02920 [Roseburia sp. NSJ-9]|uniref:Uncharacterized protein n=1 Tax=Roseburia lenta TaxID=2763061 RepID=A0ABR7GFK6_9FIRM|nr:hypothetical protein [Roseburia lenta]MBC5685576.1 hypothetical protein [Roseburia lenta]